MAFAVFLLPGKIHVPDMSTQAVTELPRRPGWHAAMILYIRLYV